MEATPFLSILGASILFAFIAGIDLADIPGIIENGFGSMFSSIGIVTVLGTLIGALLERTGAARKMAACVVKLAGKKQPEAALILMGWLVSIPVFCDSGFIMLNPIRKALVQRTGSTSEAGTVALSMGLYISHCLIPPTPGPLAAASTLFLIGLGSADVNMLFVIGIGALCSIPAMFAIYGFARLFNKRVGAGAASEDSESALKAYETVLAEDETLPGGIVSFLPIVVPIVLMGIASTMNMHGVTNAFVAFLGAPMIAIGVGALLGVGLLVASGKGRELYDIMNDALKTAGPIFFITSAGGVLGKVIASSALVPFIEQNALYLQSLGLLFPFLLAAILRTSLGSSTVSLTTTAGIVAPLMRTMGFTTPLSTALLVAAIGAGAMIASHANDSYFWVVTSFGEIQPQARYRTHTLATVVAGVGAFLGVLAVSLFI